MDNAGKHSGTLRIVILAIAVFACTWFLSSGAGLAESASSSVNVSVTVFDTVGVGTGESAISGIADCKSSQVFTKFVTRATSSRLGSEQMLRVVRGTGAFTIVGMMMGTGAKGLSNDDVVPGDEMQNHEPASEVIVTVSTL